MTQKQIKEEIKLAEERLEEIKEGYREIPEYEELQEELDEINKKRAQIERRQIEIKREYLDEVEDDIKYAREDVSYNNDLLRKVQQGLDPNDFNDELIKMYKAFYSGSTWGYRKKLQWVSDDGKYALFKVDSHSAYIDRMTGSVSSEAQWCLFIIDPEFDSKNGRARLEPNSDLCIWHKDGGRWGSKRDMKLVEEAIDNYENNDFMSQFMEANGFKLVTSHHESAKWVNENVVIKYQTTSTPRIGLDAGKTIVKDHEKFSELRLRSSDYYINMPTNEGELAEKYPDFYQEWQENK